MATMLEQLAAAFPEQIERIKACAASTERLAISEKSSAGHALAAAFQWATTDEGHTYWRDLARTAGWLV